MNNLSDVKRRIASVKQTRQITGAMETISIAKMRKSVEQFEQNKGYFDVVCGLAESVALMADNDAKEYLKAPIDGKTLVMVISSDKGFCGAFNHDVFRMAESLLDDNSVVMPIGKTARDFYIGRYAIDERFVSETGTPNLEQAKRIAQGLLSSYGNGINAVKIVYTRLVKTSWSPQVIDALPFKAKGERSADYLVGTAEFVPSASAVLKKLIPMYVSGVIYGAFVHSAASEHSARRVAMSSSTKNADEMIAALSLSANRARQSAVTEQITEIIGSTQALGRSE